MTDDISRRRFAGAIAATGIGIGLAGCGGGGASTDSPTDTATATEESGGGHGGGGGMSYEATIEWDTGNGTESATVSQHGNVTLSDQTFFAHFNSGEEVVISSNFETLREYNTETAQFEEHTNGLWGVSILTGLVGMLMIGMAYLPSRY